MHAGHLDGAGAAADAGADLRVAGQERALLPRQGRQHQQHRLEGEEVWLRCETRARLLLNVGSAKALESLFKHLVSLSWERNSPRRNWLASSATLRRRKKWKLNKDPANECTMGSNLMKTSPLNRFRTPSGTTSRCTASSCACRTRAPASPAGGCSTRTPPPQ